MKNQYDLAIKKDGSPAHIMIISSWYPSVSHPVSNTFVHEQAVALVRAGYKVTVVNADIVSFKAREKWGLSVRNTDGVNIFQLTLPVYAGFSVRPYIFTVEKATEFLYKKAIKKFGKPDLIHIHAACFAGPTGVRLAKKDAIACVYTEHFSKINTNILSEEEKNSIVETVKGSDKVIAVSPVLAEKMEKFGANAAFIPNVLDNKTFNYSPIDHDKFTFVSVARLVKLKGMDILLKAFKTVNEKYPETRLKICGNGTEMDNLKKTASELEISDSVSFMGERQRVELSKDLNSSDCFVLASYAETFGVVYIEALACGLPVIGTHCGGPECIVNEKNGILVDTGNPEQLAEAMEYIYLNRKNYNGQNLSNECIDLYGCETIAKQLTNIYSEYIDFA